MMAELRVADTAKSSGEARSSAFCRLFDTYQPVLRRLVAACVATPRIVNSCCRRLLLGCGSHCRFSVEMRASAPGFVELRTTLPFGANAEDALLVAERQMVLMNGIRELPVLD